MSEQVKITVVTNDVKSNTGEAPEKQKTVVVTHETGQTLMSALLENGLIEGEFCRQRGVCGRCRVRYISPAPMPSALERRTLDAAQLREGYRLACMVRPKDDCVIQLACRERPGIQILTQVIGVSSKNDQYSQQQKETDHRKADVMKKIVAVDLGTTTIAMQLRDGASGEVLATHCEQNPQRSYGADVLSRIQASCDGAGERLRRAVWEVLERGMAEFTAIFEKKEDKITNVIDKIACMCIAGNTAMVHLLMGYNVSGLGRSPFTPVTLGLLRSDWKGAFPIYIVPGISAFVGGDIVAGLYALSMLPGQGAEQKGARLLIDLGTNGEIVAVEGDRLIATATAAGPAFEGGAGADIIGTDMIAVTAALLRRRIMDETGLMREPYFQEGATVYLRQGRPEDIVPGQGRRDDGESQAVYIRNQDIRDLQMAKAAVRAGVETLLELLKQKEPEQVCLAGGFGYFLDIDAAFAIGLLPEELRGRVQAVGNTALEGAYRIGRDLAGQRITGQELEGVLARAEALNLAQQARFEQRYIEALNF